MLGWGPAGHGEVFSLTQSGPAQPHRGLPLEDFCAPGCCAALPPGREPRESLEEGAPALLDQPVGHLRVARPHRPLEVAPRRARVRGRRGDDGRQRGVAAAVRLYAM